MAKQSNQKAKLLYLQKFLMEDTDAEHGITIAELTEKLAAVGIAAERKSLYDDIEVLRSIGMNIETIRGRANSYKLVSRTLAPQDVVKAGKALKETGTVGADGIIALLCSLLSKYDAETVKAALAAVPKKAKAAAAAKAEPPAEPEAAKPAEPVNMQDAETVELKCAAELQDDVMAYFGATAQVVKTKGSNVVISGQAVCGEAFYLQLIRWGSGVKLSAPSERRKEFVKYCKKIISQYK